MSIFEKLFGPAPTAQAPANPNLPTPGQIPATAAATLATASTTATAPNGTVPASPVVVEGAAKSGLDAFTDIWNTEANPNTPGQPLFNTSHDKMMEAARKQNFNAGITPELMAKVAAGGTEGVQAMMEMMNTMVQNGYAQSAFAGTKLIEGALEKSQFAKTTDIDSRIRSTALSSTLQSENPALSHPAAQPLLASIQSTLLTKFPNATPQELSSMAKDYLGQFAAAVTGPATAATVNATAGNKDFDFSTWG